MKSVTQEQFDKCCEITSSSNRSLTNICNELGCGYGAMRYFIDSSSEASAKYARAKEAQADFLAEEIIEISDDDSEDEIFIETENGPVRKENKEFTNRSRLRVDARKWVAAHLRPRKYGDQLDVTSNGKTVSVAGSLAEARKRVQNRQGTLADDLI